MGVREDGGWQTSLNYTPILSAVIKVSRIMVLYHVYSERQMEIREIMWQKNIGEADA